MLVPQFKAYSCDTCFVAKYLWLSEQVLGITVQPYKLRVLDRYDISVLRLVDMVPWLARCPGQRYVSLLGPSGPEGCRRFWEEARTYPWGAQHPVIIDDLWSTGSLICIVLASLQVAARIQTICPCSCSRRQAHVSKSSHYKYTQTLSFCSIGSPNIPAKVALLFLCGSTLMA